jgi:predicted RNA-binding Zn-ribbon protein involved in translation (DUF1610 family)
MSDTARDLLVHGVAAAKGNSRDEARHYLEWVLRTDADLEQQAEAWYWLSRITDDPVPKRDCLENVLAITPRHPEARRDIAVLDGRLRPEVMHDPRFGVAPVVPNLGIDPGDTQAYTCPRCGARIAARGMDGGLLCGFCGYAPDAKDSQDTQLASDNEQDWVAAIYAVQGHRWQLPRERAFTCGTCGAMVVMPPSNVSADCPFCGTSYVTQTADERELIEPTGVVPFAFDAQDAWARIGSWLGEQRFAPADLDEQAAQALPRPIYLPFWTFDIEGEIGWRGWEVSTSHARPVRAPVSGSVPLLYDDILVPATRSVPEDLLSALEYDTRRLIPYSPDLLASWPAEVYSVALADASLVAREFARRSPRTQGLLNTSVSVAGNIQDLAIEGAQLSVLSYKLALLPVWVGGYMYEGKSYRVLVNGQTGVVEGEVPRNTVQRLLDELFDS